MSNPTKQYYDFRKHHEPAFSQSKLAADIGVTTRTVERWCAGSVPTPRYAVIAVARMMKAAKSKARKDR